MGTNSGESVQNELDQNRNRGCGILALLFLSALWVMGVCGLSSFFSWSIEESYFEFAYALPDLRWAISLATFLGLVIPLGVLYLLVKAPRAKVMLRTWLLGSLFILATLPARLAGVLDASEISLLDLGGILILLFGIFFWKSFRPASSQPGEKQKVIGGYGLAALLAGAASVPWILWGALGSIEDILLRVLVSAAAGVTGAIMLNHSLFQPTQVGDRPYKGSDLFVDGLTAGVFLLQVGVALGQSLNQQILAISLPAAGWAVAGLSLFNRDMVRSKGWLPSACLIGWLVSLPLIWFDADELTVMLGGKGKEILAWSGKSAWTTAIILAVGAVFFFLRILDAEKNPRWSKRGGWAIPAILALLAGIYLFAGQTGLYGDRLFVILRDQADLSQAVSITDVSARRQAVYDLLRETADQSQQPLRNALDQWGIDYTPYYLVNAMEIRGGVVMRWWLENQPAVAQVLESPRLRPMKEPQPAEAGAISNPPEKTPWNLELVGADTVWKELGITGEGIVIGQGDSGVDGSHPELAQAYRGAGGSQDYNWIDPWNGSTFPVDNGGHGTHTLGTILGKTVGMAPGAKWIGCVNLGRNLGNPAYYLNCMQFFLAPYPQKGDAFQDGKPELGANVINNSWGCPVVEGCSPEVFEPAVSALKTAGIFVVSAAGNNGVYGCGTVTDPLALYEQVFSVGAIDRDGESAIFSSIGPVVVDGSNRLKPEIMAPGVNVLSAMPGNTYGEMNGTSMAAPHVSGAVALIWSANPLLIGNIDETEKILEGSAARYAGDLNSCLEKKDLPNNQVGYGILNVFEAVKQALVWR